MSEDQEKQKRVSIDVSSSTILKIIVVLALLWFVYLIKEVLAILFVAIILTSAFTPWVTWLKRKKIPRALSVVIIYIIILSILGLIVGLMVDPFVEQIGQLRQNLPAYFEGVTESFTDLQAYLAERGYVDNLNQFLTTIQGSLTEATGGILGTVTGIFGGIFSLIIILVLTFYMTVEEDVLKRVVWSITPIKYQPFILQKIAQVQKKLGKWFKGQLILMLIIGVISFVCLKIIGVKYALVLALIAGVFEIVPILGPIMAGVIAVVLVLASSGWLKAFFVIIIYIFIQQIENNWLVPKIMQKAVGLNPIISIVVLLIGAKLAGIIGALLAIPLAVVIGVLAKDLVVDKEEAPQQ